MFYYDVGTFNNIPLWFIPAILLLHIGLDPVIYVAVITTFRNLRSRLIICPHLATMRIIIIVFPTTANKLSYFAINVSSGDLSPLP